MKVMKDDKTWAVDNVTDLLTKHNNKVYSSDWVAWAYLKCEKYVEMVKWLYS